MTTDEAFKYDRKKTPARLQCCANDEHFWRNSWKLIMQIQVEDDVFMTTLTQDMWGSDILTAEFICNQAKRWCCYSREETLSQVREAEKFTFDKVFRQAEKKEVLDKVDLKKTWFLNPQVQLPDWGWETLGAVVTHVGFVS